MNIEMHIPVNVTDIVKLSAGNCLFHISGRSLRCQRDHGREFRTEEVGEASFQDRGGYTFVFSW